MPSELQRNPRVIWNLSFFLPLICAVDRAQSDGALQCTHSVRESKEMAVAHDQVTYNGKNAVSSKFRMSLR